MNMIELVGRGRVAFKVSLKAAKLSGVLEGYFRDHAGDEDDDMRIDLPKIDAVVLKKVIEFCTHHEEIERMTEIPTPFFTVDIRELVQRWYSDFINVRVNLLFKLMAAAHYLEIRPLLSLTCFMITIFNHGKSEKELIRFFNIAKKGDVTTLHLSLSEKMMAFAQSYHHRNQDGGGG